MSEKAFSRSIKGKIFIGFLVGCTALLAAWTVNSLAFQEMLQTVEELSGPNKKQRAVNQLVNTFTHAGQLQKVITSSADKTDYKEFIKESAIVQNSLDSLRQLCFDNYRQSELINSVQQLMTERKKLFLGYLKARKELLNYDPLSEQIASLEEILAGQEEKVDRVIHTTEKKVVTTLTTRDSTVPEVKRGFWDYFFKKNIKKEREPEKIVQEEVNTRIDTLIVAKPDSILEKAEMLLQSISLKQKDRQQQFYNKEVQLAEFDRIFLNRIARILYEVQKEVVQQTFLNNTKAKKVATNSAEKIRYILIGFFIITVVLVFFMLADISKSNSYRLRLEQSKEEAEFHSLARQRFLSNMSHEIRTPLQSIIGYAEQVKDQEKPDKGDLDAIYHSAEHLLQIVNEVLDYSRISSGKFTFENKVFEMATLLRETMSLLQPQADKKSIKLELHHVLEQDTYVEGDPFRLKQVLLNVLGNSIKFTKTGRVSLTADTSKTGNEYLFKFIIEDTGIGIPAEKLSYIFNQFEQADASIVRKFGGTGLGLSIVKALVKEQKGRLAVNSEPGKGTLFTIELEFKKASAPFSKQVKIKEGKMKYSGKVWMVDDDQLILQLCSKILTRYGIEHACFNSSEELLKAPWDGSVTHLLADIRMPGMSGSELCSELRKRTTAGLQIIAFTAHALPEECESILNQGFDRLLKKPFKESELIEVLSGTTAKQQREFQKNPASIEFSLSSLEQMTFGDKDLIQRILKQFVADSKDDMEQLWSSLSENKTEDVFLLLHRMAGRTSQIGNIQLGTRFRNAERAFQEKKQTDTFNLEIMDLTKDLTEFTQKIKAEIS